MLRFIESIIIVFTLRLTLSVAPTEVVVLISSQHSSYHHQLGKQLRHDIINQSHALYPDYVINVHIIHEIFKHPGEWSILTTLPHLTGKTQIVNDNAKWIILCEDSTQVKLQPLLTKLSQENHTKALFLGHTLFDHEATIIHHFAFFENPKWFPYPLLRAGVVFSATLFRRLAALIATGDTQKLKRHTEFTIDAAHELARFILDNVQVDRSTVSFDAVAGSARRHGIEYDGKNDEKSLHSLETTQNFENNVNMRKIIMRKAPYICANVLHASEEQTCLMYAQPTNATTCIKVKREHIYFAIKTCQKFHYERVPVIEATWAPYAIHRRYFSDNADADIPSINTGVPNVETGHCAKTLAILKLALNDIEQMNRQQPGNQAKHIRWLLLSDDDTLLSVSGICEVLGCFDPTRKVYLGERYGYRLHAEDGFNYITGGGGIAMSLPVIKLILKHCTCPSPSAPDDMILGACLHSMQVRATHSPRFHQARPNDYARELLQLEPPVSFHKFWQLDPLEIYANWFKAEDRRMLRLEDVPYQLQELKTEKRSSNDESQGVCNLLLTTKAHRSKGSSSDKMLTDKQAFLSEFSAFQHTKTRHLEF